MSAYRIDIGSNDWSLVVNPTTPKHVHPLGISASISVFRFVLALPFAGMSSLALSNLVFGYLFLIVDVAISYGVRLCDIKVLN